MNRDVHRIVFNQARGQSMAVPESAAARGQTTNRQRIRRRGAGDLLASLKPLCFALLWSFGAAALAPVQAQVVAYKAAPGNLRPTIFQAGNGVPLINIQTPSAAGVSRNQYERLDAGPQGVIFNNSRTDVATQLGGWVQGNPWLAKGSARVILNEVLSGQPSQLNGYLEIAGQRAQLVIANPAGVTCDGCGFLNANRVTLTTGTPLLNGGNLEGYRVDGGQIRIEGNGLDASRVDYTDLIARAVQVNAGLWAQHLAVTAGANRVDAGHTQATPIAGSGPAPAFAIDVAQLGGMYAGKITLLGTEAGVGVRNAGTLAASAGEVVVTSEGKLINAGAIDAGNARITAATLTNQGQIYGDHLAIATQDLHNANTAVIAARNRLDLGVDTLNNHPDALLFSAGDLALGGALTAEGLAAGRATRVSNDGARIEALGEISLAAETIDNTNAHLETRTVIVDQRAFDEYQGVGSGNRYTYDAIQLVPHEDFTRLQAPDGLYNDWYRYSYTRTTSETQVVSSQPGRILAGGDVNLNADILNNLDSQIVAGGTLHGNFGTLNNQATPGKRTIQDDGTAYYYWRDKEDGDDDQGLSVSRYLPAPTLQHIDLGAFAYQDASAGGGAQPAAPGAVLPANRLYRLHAGGGYLLETDPVFANYRTWLSSDYLLQALSLDPAQMQKRLGDGFYEQRLIAEQVAQLTGRRFLAGYADDEAQYQALMAAGVSVAQEWQLIPGVALSAAQVAQLTTDIVWLVSETVTLPDGSTQQALVPRVYARLQDGDLAPSGALLAGNTLQLDTTGDLTNSGSIAGRQAVSITAENLRNLGTIQGEAVALAGRQDIDIEGGAVVAGDALTLLAGRDLRVTSTTQSQANAQGQRTNLDRVAGLYVTGEAGLLLASAGQDISLTGAELVSRGDALLQAGRDLNLDTVRESARQRLTYDARNARSDHQSQDIGSTLLTGGKLTLLAGHDVTARAAQVEAGQALTVAAGNDIRLTAGEAALGLDEAHQHTSKGSFSRTTRTTRDTLEQTTAIASSLGGETVLIQAGRDLTLSGSNAVADADIALIAGRDLTLEAATETYTETHFKDKKKSGFSASLTTGLSYGKSSLKEDGESTTATAVGSQIGGNDVLLSAGRDATIVGSSVLADRDLDVIAGRDVNLLAAENRFTEDYRFKSSGSSLALIPGPAPRQTLYGKTEMSQDSLAAGNSATASLLSANGGALTIIAGTDASHAGTGRCNVTSEGADLLARQTVRIEGNAVSLLASDSRSQFDSVTKTKSITVGAALAGTVGSLVTRAYDMAEASRQGTGNRRLDNALALKAGYDGWKAYDNLGKALAVEADGAAAADGAKGNGSAFGVSVSVGVSKMKSTTHEASHSQRGTSIQAEHINITARDTDITAVGAKLQADGDITLDAQRNIDLLAAVNTEAIRNRSKGSSASLGVTVGIGQQTGISIQIGASQMKGKADGDATTYDNTEIVAGKTLTLKSGQDTTLKGAQVAGERVVADIGGNLSIETLQDQSRYKSKQSESGFSVSLCIPPICYGASSGTVSAANQKIDHSYRSAQGQSGIAAGEGGFEIDVGGNTHLKGAAITSQATADKNTLTTGSLSYEDLTNTQHTEASSSSFSISGGTDISKSLLPTASNSLAGQAAGNLLGNLAGQNGLPDDNSESSQTLAVISPATITLTGTGNPDTDAASQQAAEALTQRDAETANQALTDTLTLQDAARIERQMQEAKQNAAAANLIGQTVAGLIGDLADQMKKPINDATLRQVLDEKQAAADKGGPPLTNVEQYELNRLNGEGMSSEKAAQTLANPEAWANYDNWQEGGLNKTILHGLAGIIQAKVGDGNALVGAAAGALNEALLPEMEKFLDAQNITDPEARKGYLQLGSALLGAGLGAVADGTGGAALGGTVAYNATTYNYLDHRKPNAAKLSEKEIYERASEECQNGNEQACRTKQELAVLSAQRDALLKQACTSGPTQQCRILVAEAKMMGNVVLGQYGQLVWANSPDSNFPLNVATIGPIPPNQAAKEAWHNQQAGNLAEGLILGGSIAGGELLAGSGVLLGVGNTGRFIMQTLRTEAQLLKFGYQYYVVPGAISTSIWLANPTNVQNAMDFYLGATGRDPNMPTSTWGMIGSIVNDPLLPVKTWDQLKKKFWGDK